LDAFETGGFIFGEDEDTRGEKRRLYVEDEVRKREVDRQVIRSWWFKVSWSREVPSLAGTT